MGYYNSILGGQEFLNNLSATYYWPVIFNNIIKPCTNDYSAFDLRYYSSANKQSQELVTQCLLVAAGKIVDDDSVRAEAAVQVTAVMNTNSVQNKLRIG